MCHKGAEDNDNPRGEGVPCGVTDGFEREKLITTCISKVYNN